MLIERDLELQAINQALDLADSGKGQIVLVSGEAGIGKSSLIRCVRDEIPKSHPDFNWIEGGCEALFTPRTLGPIYDMAPQLGRMVDLALSADGGPVALYTAFMSALEDVQPTIIVCEDLHWADHATLDLIKYVARRIGMLRVVLVLTFRDDEITLTHPLTQLLGDLPGSSTTRLTLKPLTPKGVSMLAGAEGHDGAALFVITEGNPFYTTELLAAGPEPNYVPASVKDTISLRLARLTPPERNVLERMSVLTHAPRHDFLTDLLGNDADDLITQCIERGFLKEDGPTIRFRHELARLAVLDRIAPARRRQFHADCLACMEQRTPKMALDLIVHHAAGAYDAQKVLEYAPSAAQAAAIAGSHIEAAAHYHLALRFVDEAEPELAATLYESWSYESSLADHMDDDVLDARRHAITLWRALKRPERVGQNLRHLSRLHWYRGESALAARYADQAIDILESLPASSERGMAYSMRSQLHMLNDQMSEAIVWGFRALDFESDYPNPDLRMHALNNIGTAMVFRGNQDGMAHLKTSLGLAIAHGHHENAARAYNNMAEYAVEFRHFELAEEIISAGLSFDTQHDLDAWTHYLSGRLAQLRLDQGRIHDAIQIAEGVLNLDQLVLMSRLPATLVLSKAKMRQDAPEAQDLLRQTLEKTQATDELQYIVPARLAQIEAAWLSGTRAQAVEHIENLLNLTSEDRHPWNLGARACWADRFGLKDPAAESPDLPEPFRLELEGDYNKAAETWDELGLPYDAALVRLRGETQCAIEKALVALEKMSAHLGVKAARHRAESLGLKLTSTEGRRGPYQAARNHPLGLTAKEQQILSLLKEGLSNRDISDELNRSQRTVEHHVSSILSKLNAPNRMAAILRVQREPWLI
ncbi:MAG: LuxR family transcriptional regulator [Ponticaulis sp.]|nr:LuxR family transcriptional regulator [Ponticaulis sp.]